MHELTSYRRQFFDSLFNQDLAGGASLVESAIASGAPPERILLEVVSPAMDEIGKMQANQEITLSEIYVISKIAERAINRLLELMPASPLSIGTVAIGTVAGDYHGLGSKIVSSFLRAAGLSVHDLGLSVSGQDFVDGALAIGASVICASALLLHTAEHIREIRSILHERGLEDRIKLVVGGAPFNFDCELYRTLGADATAVNASAAAAVVRHIMEGR
ncbi:MAG: cobalamin-dependent protein [Anaerolineae bacterium]